MNVLIVGAGMYVCGRGTDGLGTVLPTVAQTQAQGLVNDIAIATASQASIPDICDKAAQLGTRLGTQLRFRAFACGAGRDPLAYHQVLASMTPPVCAVVVVPDHLHTPIGMDIIRGGFPLLMVKPLAPTLAEARQLTNALEARHLYGAVEFHKRFDEANLLLRHTIRDGRLGALRYITVAFSQRRAIRTVFKSWIDETNVFQYLGVHYADLIYFLTGALPVRVLATGQPRVTRAEDIAQCDAIQALVEWREPRAGRAFLSSIATNWIDADRSSAMSDQQITVVGTEGRYQSDQKQRGVQLVTQQGGMEELNPYFSQIYADATNTAVVEGYGPRCIRQFLTDVAALAQGECQLADLQLNRPTFQQALISTAIVDAVRRSLLADEQWMAVDPSAFDQVMAAAAMQETVFS